jgi:hypothetical protein
MDASDDLIATGAFVECVFHCPTCGLGGTSLIRPETLNQKHCLGCGSDVVVTMLGRFTPSEPRKWEPRRLDS